MRTYDSLDRPLGVGYPVSLDLSESAARLEDPQAIATLDVHALGVLAAAVRLELVALPTDCQKVLDVRFALEVAPLLDKARLEGRPACPDGSNVHDHVWLQDVTSGSADPAVVAELCRCLPSILAEALTSARLAPTHSVSHSSEEAVLSAAFLIVGQLTGIETPPQTKVPDRLPAFKRFKNALRGASAPTEPADRSYGFVAASARTDGDPRVPSLRAVRLRAVEHQHRPGQHPAGS